MTLSRRLFRTSTSRLRQVALPRSLPCTASLAPVFTHPRASLTTAASSTTTVDPSEILKFSRAAAEWWNPHGEFGMLHRMNPVRVRYIRSILEKFGGEGVLPVDKPFQGMRMLDIGCGGGLLSESLARLGATVVGADASEENIKMAQVHAAQDPGLHSGPGSIEYRHITAEQLAADGEQFDVVCGLEIIEHVVSPADFVRICADLVKPSGHIFFSTINRTSTSYLFTILLAEHLLRWVPVGTHEHQKYVTPDELAQYLAISDCDLLDESGIAFEPWRNQWKLLDGNGLGDMQMNYIVAAKKRGGF
ncbi:hypothetical protein HK104_011251 [Borealophlyctis nickersoniae]|nr:hypothetical protein HK104_011251 [Borealophlyctis nickersoniae]